MTVAESFPTAHKYERQIRALEPRRCHYCHRAAVYKVEIAFKEENGEDWRETDDVCSNHFNHHYPDVEVTSILRQSGAAAEGRWGGEHE